MNEIDYTILLVEDDDNDATLLKLAFKHNKITSRVQWVKDGAEAMDYLNGKGDYARRDAYPFPDVMILDLKMPRMNGLELLEWIGNNSHYRIIPTIVMTSSRQDPDIEKAYELGANTYMIKPSSFDELVEMAGKIHAYWKMAIKPRAKLQVGESGEGLQLSASSSRPPMPPSRS